MKRIKRAIRIFWFRRSKHNIITQDQVSHLYGLEGCWGGE